MKKIYLLLVFVALIGNSGFLFAQNVGLQFSADKENSLVDCGPSDNFCPEELSIEVWFYIDSLVGSGDYLISNEGWDDASVGYSLRMDKSKSLMDFTIGDGSDWVSVKSDSASLVTEQWIHAAVTYNDTKMVLYLDGEETASTDLSSALNPTTKNLIIGEGADWRGRRFFGKIHDVRIWNDVRTAQEIIDNKDALLSGDEENLVANWQFNDTTKGTSVTDITGNYTAELGADVTWWTNEEYENPQTTSISSVDNDLNINVYSSQGNLFVNNNESSNISCNLIDISGTTIKSFIVSANEQQIIEVNNAPGMYFLQVETMGSYVTKKLIVY